MFGGTISITQATLESVPGAIDTRIYSQTNNATIGVFTETLTTAVDVPIELTMTSKKNVLDSATLVTSFVITFGWCPPDFPSTGPDQSKLELYLRSPAVALKKFRT